MSSENFGVLSAQVAVDVLDSMGLQHDEIVNVDQDPDNIVHGYDITGSEAEVDQDLYPNITIINVDDNGTDYETAVDEDDDNDDVDDDNVDQDDDGEEDAESFVPRPCDVTVVNIGSVSRVPTVGQIRCPYYNVGYCKFRVSCRNFHAPKDCLDSSCFGKSGACMDRHRIVCERDQKGKCSFGQRCEFYHDGQTGIARTPLSSRNPRESRRKPSRREDRRRGGSDSESNSSGDTESNGSRNESRSNTRLNGTNSRNDENLRGKLQDLAKKLHREVNDKINNLNREHGNLAGFVQSNTEKVKKVERDLHVIGKEVNDGVKNLTIQLDKTTKGFEALSREFNSLKQDCMVNHRNQEYRLKELSLVVDQDSTHPSDDERNISVHESTIANGQE